MCRNYDAITFLQITVPLRKSGVADFAENIQIAIALIKITFKNSIEVKRNNKPCIKTQVLSKIANFW